MNYLRRQTVLPHITRSVRRLSNNTAKVLRNNSLPLAQAAPVGSGVGPPLLSANCKGGERFQSALLQSLRFHTHTCRQLHVTAHNGAEQEDTPTTIGQVNSSGRKNLYIMFTCTVCDTRSMKGMSRKVCPPALCEASLLHHAFCGLMLMCEGPRVSKPVHHPSCSRSKPSHDLLFRLKVFVRYLSLPV